MKLFYDVKDKPSFKQLLVFALQQVLAVMAATIAVPVIIGLPTQIPAAILGAGVGTLVYLLFTKFKSPVILSSSFAFLGSLATAIAFGYMGIILGAIFAGGVYIIIAIVVKIIGTKWVSKLMPPVIIGPTVALIGLSLAGNAVGDLTKASAAGMPYNLVAIFCGLVAFFTIIICSVQKKRKSARLIPFIIGIGAGYLAASIFTVFGMIYNIEYLKIVDWTPLVSNFVQDGAFTGVTAFFNYPDFALIEAIKEFTTGNVSEAILAANSAASVLTPAGIAEVAIAFVPVAFVVFAEHIADHKNLGSIIGKDLVEKEPGLGNTLLGDGVGSILGTMFGICPNTTYGESVGCVAITRNASIRTIVMAAFMCIILSFISPIMALLQTIPSCVMGGVCLTLYGFIAVSGLKMFKEIDLGENKNLFPVAVILITGIGGLAIKIPYQISGNGEIEKVITITSIATALILGIITYAIINSIEKRDAKAGLKEEEDDDTSLMGAPIATDSSYLVGGDEEEDVDVVAAPTTNKRVVTRTVTRKVIRK